MRFCRTLSPICKCSLTTIGFEMKKLEYIENLITTSPRRTHWGPLSGSNNRPPTNCFWTSRGGQPFRPRDQTPMHDPSTNTALYSFMSTISQMSFQFQLKLNIQVWMLTLRPRWRTWTSKLPSAPAPRTSCVSQRTSASSE